jgi:hypothetical protein
MGALASLAVAGQAALQIGQSVLNVNYSDGRPS